MPNKLDIHIEDDNKADLPPPDLVESVQDDLDDLHLATPSSLLNERAGKKSPRLQAKRIGKWKVKAKPRLSDDVTGECYLLQLPQDILHVLLAHIPPRSLHRLAATCQTLRRELEDDSLWRQSYMNRFIYDGASRSTSGKAEAQVLIQTCNGASRGWRREGLDREAMLNRWSSSKAAPVTHHPPVGLIHSLSLSYPPFTPALKTPSLIVGKTHQTPTKASSSSPPSNQMLAPSPSPNAGSGGVESPAPTKMTHRQKYEALLAATTRPAPYILSAGLGVGGVVRSDPVSGKVSKGFWGPGHDANFHLRPRLDGRAPPSALFLPRRDQSFVLWGLLTGGVVHTTIVSKHSSTPGTRASSINVECSPDDAHEGEVLSVWAEEPMSETPRFVSSGADGKVKYWQLDTISTPRSGKKTPTQTSRLMCIFTSKINTEPLQYRSDLVKLKQAQAPDAIQYAQCHAQTGTVCGITEDGDLRVWFDCGSKKEKEVRIDAGSQDDFGAVSQLELNVIPDEKGETVTSILVHHHRGTIFDRHEIKWRDGAAQVNTQTYGSPVGGQITALRPYLEPTLPIASQTRLQESIISSSTLPALPAEPQAPIKPPTRFGRFVVAGDEHGIAYIYPWDASPSLNDNVQPIRVWPAVAGKVTTIDMACGIIAVACYDGHVKIFDPLPVEPSLLRTFRPSHLSSADLQIAASEQFDARWYTPNQIILDNDMIVCSLGRKIFGWRAGSGKGRQAGKSDKRVASGGKAESRGSSRTMDLRSLHADAADDQAYMDQDPSEPYLDRGHAKAERQHIAALDELGIDDGDEALQYALMLSMEDAEAVDEAHAIEMSRESSGI